MKKKFEIVDLPTDREFGLFDRRIPDSTSLPLGMRSEDVWHVRRACGGGWRRRAVLGFAFVGFGIVCSMVGAGIGFAAELVIKLMGAP